jgi:hypothetical protein
MSLSVCPNVGFLVALSGVGASLSSEFKYQDSSKEVDLVGRLDSTHRSGTRKHSPIHQLFRSQVSKGITKTDRFFRRNDDYKAHSIQLVEVIPKWLGYGNFDHCDYSDSGVRFTEGIDYYLHNLIPYINHLKQHLAKGYPDIMSLYDNIKKNHTDWSQKIKEIMSGRDVPFKPSFEKIITDSIKTSCPALKESNNTELTENNVYIVRSVFNILFKTVYNNLDLDPLEVKSSGSTFQLEYDHRTIVAQGDEFYMNRLKDQIIDLAKAENLRNIIRDYRDLNSSLRLDKDFNDLKSKLMDVYNSVRGGMPLKADGACELCPPALNS